MNTTQKDVYLEQLIRENEEEVDLIHLGRPHLEWRFSVTTLQRPSLQEERLLRQVGDGGRCEIFAGRFDLSECSPEEREAIEKLELGHQTYLSYSPAARGVIGG